MKPRFTPLFLEDMTNAQDYLFERSPQAARNVGERIQHSIRHLLDYSASGRVGRVEGTREYAVPNSPFILIYRIDQAAQWVEFLNLLHSARKWPPG